MRTVLMLLIVVLAGCADSDPSDVSDGPGVDAMPPASEAQAEESAKPTSVSEPKVPAPQSVDVQDCTIDQGLLPLASADAPDGFTPAIFLEPWLGVGQSPAPIPLYELDVGFLTCQSVELGETQQFLAGIAVNPPAEYAAAGVNVYYHLLAVASGNGPLLELYNAWGLPVENASVSVTSTGVAPLERLDWEAAGHGFTSDSISQSGAARPGEYFRFLYDVNGSMHALDVQVGEHSTMFGVAQWSPGSGLPSAAAPGVVARVRDAGWDVTWTHVVFN